MRVEGLSEGGGEGCSMHPGAGVNAPSVAPVLPQCCPLPQEFPEEWNSQGSGTPSGVEGEGDKIVFCGAPKINFGGWRALLRTCVCVCACARARSRARVRAHVRAFAD